MRRPFTLAILLLLAACARAPVATSLPRAASGLHLTDLQGASLGAALEKLPCPCSSGRSLGRCAEETGTCPSAARLQRIAALLARQDAGPDSIVREIQADRQSYAAPRKPIDLTEVACRGGASAPVTLVVYSDFECPGCAWFRDLSEPLMEQLGVQARLCFKHFPLKRHANAHLAAQAAEFARAHGKFWEMHDRFFSHPESLSMSGLREHAAAVGLDAEALQAALVQKTYASVVDRSVEEGRLLGGNGTPFLFINGRPLTLPLDPEIVVPLVEEEAERARRGNEQR